MRQNSEDYFYHKDALGSVIALTNSNGVVIETYEYSAYGQPQIKDSNGAIFSQSQFANLFLYTGSEYDSETGLNHMGYRYEDPKTGRWIQEDPIGFKGGDVNLYAYANGMPLMLTDPMGLSSIPGVDDIAKHLICTAGGDPYVALYIVVRLRDNQKIPFESLTPEGQALRYADNYLFAYWAVSSGMLGNQYITWQAFVSGGIASWQAYHLWLNLRYRAKGILDTDPPDFMAMAAGYEGANDALFGGVSCDCK